MEISRAISQWVLLRGIVYEMFGTFFFIFLNLHYKNVHFIYIYIQLYFYCFGAFIFIVCACFTCMYICAICENSSSYFMGMELRWLFVIMWVLVTDPGFSERAFCDCNHWSISLATLIFLNLKYNHIISPYLSSLQIFPCTPLTNSRPLFIVTYMVYVYENTGTFINI